MEVRRVALLDELSYPRLSPHLGGVRAPKKHRNSVLELGYFLEVWRELLGYLLVCLAFASDQFKHGFRQLSEVR